MLIFLIGLPGSGKTTLGKQLAKKLHYTFADLDEAIVKTYQASIEEIFTQKGEATFRTYESECLRAYGNHVNTIVSTGGGAPCFHDNMKWMNENGICVFLNPPLSELADRLSATNNSHRPMLRHFSKEELLVFLQTRWEERNEFYSQARYIIDKSNPSTTDIIEKIKTALPL